jgi:hypothetical protein
MRRTRRNKQKALKALVLSFAVAAVFTATASSEPSPEIPYLSHGHGVTDLPFQSAPDDGPVFMNGVPDGYVGSGVEAAPAGVTPTNLARAVARYGPYGPAQGTSLVPQTPPAEVATVSASSDGFDRDDVAVGFGLAFILATACAMALAAASGRNRMAHS